MSTKHIRIAFLLFIGSGILLILITRFSFEMLETDPAVSWTLRYFAIPILIALIPLSSFLYLKTLIQLEPRQYRSQVIMRLRTIFRIFILTLSLTILLLFMTLSMILITNAAWGKNKSLVIHSEVIRSHSNTSRGHTRYYITFFEPRLGRSVHLEVNQQYDEGARFHQKMQVGYWGLLYVG